MQKRYLLTLCGRPAHFDGNQIVYTRTRYRGSGILDWHLVQTVDEAKRFIKKTLKWRGEQGWDAFDADDYDYIPVFL